MQFVAITSIQRGNVGATLSQSVGTQHIQDSGANAAQQSEKPAKAAATLSEDAGQKAGSAVLEVYPKEKDLKEFTEQLNNLMTSMNNHIKFELHTDSATLMVQVEDRQTHKIIKEVPSHEFLDMVVRIKDCIGAFLDEKA